MYNEINASNLEDIVENFIINFEHRKNVLVEKFESKREELLPSLIKLTNFLEYYLNKNNIDSILFIEEGNFFINLKISENNIIIWLANINNKNSNYIALSETSDYIFNKSDIKLINRFLQCNNETIIDSLIKEINDKYVDF